MADLYSAKNRKLTNYQKIGLTCLILSASLYQFFTLGHTWDEWEHGHVSWLISQGKEPYYDFFEHHMPLLWDTFQIYFQMGGSGESFIYFGRIYDIFALALAIYITVKTLAVFYKTNIRFYYFIIPISIYIISAVTRDGLWVIRPETFAAPILMLSVFFWVKRYLQSYDNYSETILPTLLSAIFFGLALCASPRSIILLGAYIIFYQKPLLNWRYLLLDGFIFCLVVAATIVIEFFIFGHSLDYINFVLSFSRAVTTINHEFSLTAIPQHYFYPLLVSILITYLAWFAKPKKHKTKESKQQYRIFLLSNAYGVVLALVTILMCGDTYLDYNFSIWIMWLAFLAAFWEIRTHHNKQEEKPYKLLCFSRIMLALIVSGVTFGATIIEANRFHTIFSANARQQSAFSHLKPEDSVLMTRYYAIDRHHSSYYWFFLSDGYCNERIHNIARQRPFSKTLPEYKTHELFLSNAPALLDSKTYIYASECYGKDVEKSLKENYTNFNGEYYLRNDRIPCEYLTYLNKPCHQN